MSILDETQVNREKVIEEFTERKRIGSEIYVFLFITSTFLLSLAAFWNFQERFWNRVVYDVGSWTYVIAKYPIDEFPSEDFIGDILGQVLLFTLMSVIFTVSSVYYIYVQYRKHRSVRTLAATSVLSGLMFLAAFWGRFSIDYHPTDWIITEMDTISSDVWSFAGITLPNATAAGAEKVQFLGNTLMFDMVLTGAVFVIAVAISILLVIEKFIEKRRGPRITKARKRDLNFYMGYFFLYLILFLFLVYTILPIFYTFILSMSDAADIRGEGYLPASPLENFIVNYSSVIFIINKNTSSFSVSFLISVGLGVGTAIGGLMVALPAAYSISRFKFRGRSTFQFLVLATQMFPGVILIIPQYLIWTQLGFFSGDETLKVLGLALAYFVGAIAYNIWMMKGYFDTLPYDLEEAALIDGETEFGTFVKVALPLAVPGMVAVSLFTFLFAWNEFALAALFIGEKRPESTLPLMFFLYQNEAAPDNPVYYELLSAFSILAALPILVTFMLLNRMLTGGLTSGGIK